MTLLSEPESRAKRRPRRWRLFRSIQMLIAILRARRALARITRPKRQPISDIPPYLRRDLGLPEDGPLAGRRNGSDLLFILMAYARLK